MRLNAGLRKTHAETAQQIAARHGIPWISGKRQPPSIFVYIHTIYIIYTYRVYIYIRRKFQSQTSDNMDRWKAEVGRVRERSEKRREREGKGREGKGREGKRREEKRRRKKIKKRKHQKKEDPGVRKGRKVAKHFVFPIFVAPEGRKVGSLKRRVRSQLARWGVKNCTPLWREAHLQVKS